jgi:hypothetical protein
MATERFEVCFQSGVYIKVDTGALSPTTGETYSVTLTGTTLCATFVSGSVSFPGPVYNIGTLFDSCYDCNEFIPLSANTAYTLCTLDCDRNPVELQFPHPVWTNNNGNAVTQLNAVQLGGTYGLYN